MKKVIVTTFLFNMAVGLTPLSLMATAESKKMDSDEKIASSEKTAGSVCRDAGEVISKTAKQAREAIEDRAHKIGAGAQEAAKKTQEALSNAAEKAKEGLKSAAATVKAGAESAAGKAKKSFAAVREIVKE